MEDNKRSRGFLSDCTIIEVV